MSLIDFIFPRHCIYCSSIGSYLCKSCKKMLQPHPEICPSCHKFSKDYVICFDCKSNKNNNLEGIIIPFVYNDILKKLIIKLKYFHKKDIGGFLVERLAIALQTNETFQRMIQYKISTILPTNNINLLQSSDNIIGNSQIFISFIPSHRRRTYIIKGYNQSKILAKKLSKITNIPRIQIAKKHKHTKTQASLNRSGRLKNLINAFSLIPNLPLQGNETILIVDDITTTGSTINELAKLIHHHYPKIKVRGAVLGRHIG